jgi:hypothetical protein
VGPYVATAPAKHLLGVTQQFYFGPVTVSLCATENYKKMEEKQRKENIYHFYVR